MIPGRRSTALDTLDRLGDDRLPIPARSRPIVVGTPHEVDAEWRVFVVEGEPVSCSMYRPHAERGAPNDLLAFAARVAAMWQPAPVFALDIGRVDQDWRGLECNAFNWSRFHAADVPAVVARVSDFQNRSWG